MESRTEGSNSEVTSRPEAVHSGSASTTDGIILPITGHKLNGQNFIQWAQSVRIFICGKGKEEYLTEAIVQPKEDDPGYRTWKLENSMVMSWLINSMTNDIGENFMYYGTTKEIWDAARETYSNIDNTSAIFEIKKLVWKCPEDGLLYKKVIEKERIYKFLLGLNKNLDEQNREGRGYTAAAEEDTSGTISNPGPFSKEQLEALQKMFQQTLQSTGTTIGTASIAQKGIFSHALNVRQENHTTWIVDSGASDHMTGNLMVFHEYTPCHNNSSVQIADGTLSRVFGTALNSGKRIGNAEVRAGLYLLSAEEIRRLPMKTACVVSNPSTKTDSVVMLWHYRLDSSNDLDDLDQPIALRKGVRSCTQHPISNHVSYGKLSQNFQAFITSLEDDQLPEGKRPVGCKWIFTVKHNPDGSINRFKARLVAKGFTQSYGIDYEETFAPVAKLNSIRVLLSVAVNLDWNLHQLDVKNAFLNGELEEEAYMKIPPSMETPENSGKVCKLRKSLYGLKQSPRAWFDRLTRVVKKHGFIQCQADHTLFMKHSKEVGRTKEGIVVTQRKYVLDLLQETGMLGCKPVDTLMDPIGKIDKDNDSHPTDRDRYQRLVGKLIYLTHTRPDIGFAVSMSSGRGLYFKKTSSREVKVFTDADWAGSLTDRRSTTGYCSYVWGNLVTWRSKKQSVVARSNAEAEFRAIAHGICEGMWLQRILKELEIISNSTMTVLCDNKATISIAKNPVQHDRTKHVEIDRHFIKEKLEGGTIILMYIPSSRQTADILTKALPKATYET
ncbi:Retrovirus-related Pol polyprotein from transposon RE1 [Vitis vinifera]|uniref:Retrovirus-related Pol polyprotein from transposon RE1 n=1 Tax=Vitis vinifera TaxID=29760 RepID=A0A438ELA1_VITVI|nr:Retrovirus-related Pol polyprotein from transposon RE1 [Vitis vinifera]